jgi:putative two-component system response regulator
MPEMDGYEVIKRLKSEPAAARIPVIFLTGKSSSGDELEGLSLGAVDYIIKPFSPALLIQRIENHLQMEMQRQQLVYYNDRLQEMVDAKTKSVVELQNAILKTMAELVEYRDDITGGHIERMKIYLEVLLGELRSSGLYRNEVIKWDVDLVMQSAQLHDVGKIAIPDEILLKPGKLTDEEYEKIKEHTVVGEQIIEKVRGHTTDHAFLDYAGTFVSAHHEKWDGTGYPKGLKGEEIPLLGRVMAIIDVYDALVNERPYKKAFSHQEAVEIIKDSGGSHFDPELVTIFLKCEKKFERAIGK